MATKQHHEIGELENHPRMVLTHPKPSATPDFLLSPQSSPGSVTCQRSLLGWGWGVPGSAVRGYGEKTLGTICVSSPQHWGRALRATWEVQQIWSGSGGPRGTS